MSPCMILVLALQAVLIFGQATTQHPTTVDDSVTPETTHEVTYIFKVDLSGGIVGGPSDTAWAPPTPLEPRKRNLRCTDAEIPYTGNAFCAHMVNSTGPVVWTDLTFAFQLVDVACIASFGDYTRVRSTNAHKVELALSDVQCYSTVNREPLSPHGLVEIRNGLLNGSISELEDRVPRSFRLKDAAFALLEGTREQDLPTVVRFWNSFLQGEREGQDAVSTGQVELDHVSINRRAIVGRNFGEDENCMFDARGRCRFR